MCLFLKHPGCSTFNAKWEGARINHHYGGSVIMPTRGRGGGLDQGGGSECREGRYGNMCFGGDLWDTMLEFAMRE